MKIVPALTLLTRVCLTAAAVVALLTATAATSVADHHNEEARSAGSLVVAAADAADATEQQAAEAVAPEQKAAPACGCGMAKQADGTCGSCAAMAAIELPEETADEYVRMPCGCLKKKSDL